MPVYDLNVGNVEQCYHILGHNGFSIHLLWVKEYFYIIVLCGENVFVTVSHICDGINHRNTHQSLSRSMSSGT